MKNLPKHFQVLQKEIDNKIEDSEKEFKNVQVKTSYLRTSNIKSALIVGIGSLAMLTGCMMMAHGVDVRFAELNPNPLSELDVIFSGLIITTVGSVAICSACIKILDNLALKAGLEKEIEFIKRELENRKKIELNNSQTNIENDLIR